LPGRAGKGIGPIRVVVEIMAVKNADNMVDKMEITELKSLLIKGLNS
jgi:hypothetical protein